MRAIKAPILDRHEFLVMKRIIENRTFDELTVGETRTFSRSLTQREARILAAWSGLPSDLVANLRIIREAVGDVPVPYFRAPNGSWGLTAAVAAELGMRPLGLGNVIFDWETQDEETLVANLRSAIRPGEITLAHDGGGDRRGTVRAVRRVVTERLAEGWTFTLPAGCGPDQ